MTGSADGAVGLHTWGWTGRVTEWTSGGWDGDDSKKLSMETGKAGLRFLRGGPRGASKNNAADIPDHKLDFEYFFFELEKNSFF